MGAMQASSDNETLGKKVKTGDFIESRTKPTLCTYPLFLCLKP